MKGQNFGWFRHVVMHGSTTSKLHSFHTRNSEHQNKLLPKARVLCSSASLASMDEIDQSHQTRTIHLPIDPNNKRPGSSEDEKICCSTSMDMHTIDTSHLKCPPVSNNNTKGVYGKFWERICMHALYTLSSQQLHPFVMASESTWRSSSSHAMTRPVSYALLLPMLVGQSVVLSTSSWRTILTTVIFVFQTPVYSQDSDSIQLNICMPRSEDMSKARREKIEIWEVCEFARHHSSKRS